MSHTLLLVSGREKIINDLSNVCGQAGYKTVTAYHGNDALQILGMRNIDAVICDSTITDIDSYHLCYKIRKSEKLKNIPVILCNGAGNATEAQMANDMGADFFINEKACPETIVARITDFFSKPGKQTGRLNPPEMSTESMLQYNEQLIARLEARNIELHKAKNDLERNVKILNEAQQIAHIGSWEFNLETFESKWSEEQYKMLGTSFEETEPSLESFLSFIHPEDYNRVKVTIDDSFATQLPIEFNSRIIRKDGALRHIYAYAGYTFNAAGKPVRTYGITHDITEKLEAEQKVLHINTELEARVKDRTEALVDANQQLESFGYSVSHDLKAPLRSICGFAQILRKSNYNQLDENGKELVQLICAGTVKMQELVSDLFTFSRLGKNSLELIDIDLNVLAASTWKSLTAKAEHVPEFKIGPLPCIKGDKPMITQVVVNFLTNAIKYSSHNPNPVIEVGAVNIAGEKGLYVKDNGAGFSMDNYDKLFSVFQRLHSASEFEGTGVGLAIVKRIIDKHNGHVWAEGEQGKGAAFYFSIPD